MAIIPFSEVDFLLRNTFRITTERLEDFALTDIDYEVLSIGQKSASHCLQAFRSGEPSQLLEHLELAVNMLERYGLRKVTLQPVPRYRLAVGAALSLSCLPARHDSAEAVKHVLRLIPVQVRISQQHLALLLTAFALTISDCPGWTESRLSHSDRIERAIEAVAYYGPDIDKLSEDDAKAMIDFGLLELLSNSTSYSFDTPDFKAINLAFRSLQDVRNHHAIHTLPPDFDVRRYVMETITNNVSSDGEEHDLFTTDAPVATGYLVALDRTYSPTLGAPTEPVYAFVIECLCRSSDGFTIDVALNLMHEFPIPELSEALIWTLNSREIVKLLFTTRESNNENQKLVARGLLALLAKLTCQSADLDSDGWNELAADILLNDGPGQSVSEERMGQRWDELATEYEDMISNDQMHRDKYMNRLLGQIQN